MSLYLNEDLTLKRFLGFLFALLVVSSVANAQENCTNLIDDDGDGLIDCQDPDCGGNNVCRISPTCDQPYIYYMPPIYGDKTATAIFLERTISF